MGKRILGLMINAGSIGWALVEEYVSDVPDYPYSSENKYELKEDKYLVDSSEKQVLTFKILQFENRASLEKTKMELVKKYKTIAGADSKESTGKHFIIFTDNLIENSNTERELQVRAIHAMDWFLEQI